MSAGIERYKRAFELSQMLADKIEIAEYPINMFEIFMRTKELKVLVSSFSDYKVWVSASGRNCPDELKDAKCYFDPDFRVYIIVYNEKKPKKRIQFSLAHELGHIILEHLNDERTEIKRGGLDNITYFAMEGAANTFAGNFLAPPILIHERLSGQQFDIFDIARFFRLSKEAVRDYRIRDYKHWLNMSHSRNESRNLERCKDKMFPRVCRNCSNISYGKSYLFCPVCGKQSLSDYESEGLPMIKYEGIRLDKEGKALECPVCQNADMSSDGEYCIICGNSLVNRCSSSTGEYESACPNVSPLAGNARYCPLCGSESTFFQRSILLNWETIAATEIDDEVPF